MFKILFFIREPRKAKTMFKKSSKFPSQLIAHKLTQDRNINFDVSEKKLKIRPGEKIIEHFTSVEDTKGNNGEMGNLTVTNLRVIWVSNKVKYRAVLKMGQKWVKKWAKKWVKKWVKYMRTPIQDRPLHKFIYRL